MQKESYQISKTTFVETTFLEKKNTSQIVTPPPPSKKTNSKKAVTATNKQWLSP